MYATLNVATMQDIMKAGPYEVIEACKLKMLFVLEGPLKEAGMHYNACMSVVEGEKACTGSKLSHPMN